MFHLRYELGSPYPPERRLGIILDAFRESGTHLIHIRFEVFTAVGMKNDVFWDITPCGSCKNRRFGGTYHLHHEGDKNR
jgi:hypothetical protein